MATLSGNKIKDTYQSLVKFSDNGNITVGAKQLTDGFGNNSPIFVSTTQVGIGVTPESGLNLHVYGDAKIGSNLTVIGNLVVEGSTTTVGTDTLTVKDPLIVLANNNTSTDAVDIGFYGKYTPSGTTLYSGLFREALTGKYRLFKDLQVEPTTTVNTSGTGYTQATLIAALEGNVTGNVTGNLTGNVTGGTISGTTGTFSGNVDIDGTLDVDDVINVEGSAFGRIEIGGASGGYIDLKAPNSDDYDFRIITSSGGNEITTATGDLIFNTAETLALTIDTSQNANFEGELQIPSYIRHTGDTNTYIGFSANDTIDLVTASNVVLRIDSSNNATFSGGISATTGTFSGQVTIPETPTADTHAASKGYVDAAVEGQDTLAEILAIGNTTGGTDIAITAGDKITNFTSTGIDDNSTSTVLTIDSSNRALFSGDVSLGANLIGNTNATGDLTILGSLFVGDYGVNDDPDYLYADNNIFRIGYYSNAKQFEVNNSDFKVTATHKVGIGTNDPQTLLEVSNENSGLNPIIRLNNVDSSLSDGQNLGSIEFYNDHTNLTTANIGVFNNTDGTIVKEMKFNLGSPYGDILTLDVNEINAIKRFTITGSGTTPRVTLANNAGEGALTYSLRSQDDGYFGIFQESSQVLTISQGGDVGINADPDNYSKKELVITAPDEGGITIASATDEAAYLDFSDGSGLKNFIRVDHDGDIFGYNSWGSHEFTLGEGVPSLTLESSGATFSDNATFAGDVIQSGTSKSLKYWRRLWADANNDWGLNNNAGSSVISVSGMGTPSTSTTTFAGNLTVGRNIDLSSTDYSYIQGTHTGASDGEYVMRTFGYGDSTFYGSFDILRHDTDDGELRLRQRIAGTATDVLSIVDGNSTFAGSVQVGSTAGYTTISQGAFFTKGGGDMFTANLLAGAAVSPMFKLQRNDVEKYNIGLDGNDNLAFINASGDAKMSIDSSGDATFTGDVTLSDGKMQISAPANTDNYLKINVGNVPLQNGVLINYAGASQSTGLFINQPNGGGSGAIDYALLKVNNQGANPTFYSSNNGANPVIIKADGNVGIGTTSPYTNLEVAGSGLDSIIRLYAASGTANIRTWEMRAVGVAGEGLLFRQVNDANNSYTNRMLIDTDGSVGIGTTSIPNPFSGAYSNILQVGTTGGNTRLAITAGSTSSSDLNFADSNDATNAGSYVGAISYKHNGDYMLFSTNGSEKMRITSGGLSKFKTQAGSYGYGSGYNFHEFNNDFGNQPIAMFWQASGSGSHYGINVHNNDDENDTTSRFFMGKGGSTERIKIYSNGNIENTNNSYGQLSDIKLKENVTDATSKLEDLMKVQIKNFNYIGQEQKQIGVIAQELEQIFPNLIYETPKTKREEVNKTDNEGNIIYQTEQKLINEAVEGQDAIEWNEKPTQDNTKIEIQTWLDNNNIEWQSADTKQELLDRIPEYQQEAVEAKEAIYETIETDEPVKENVELATGEVIKGVKYSVFVPMLIKGMQEQQQLINDLKSRIETLENN
jgi:hypothetical protein